MIKYRTPATNILIAELAYENFIIGDFSKFKSKSLQDFIRESNNGQQVYFTESLDLALNRLSKK
jgi:hypothetical protein